MESGTRVTEQPPPLLTKREVETAAYAAAGFTNRQIARKMYVSVSTVEQALTRVYAKTGVTRSGLGALLDDN